MMMSRALGSRSCLASTLLGPRQALCLVRMRQPRRSVSACSSAVEELERFSRSARADLVDAQARQHPRAQAAEDSMSADGKEDARAAAAAADAAGLEEVNQDTFWPFMEAAGTDLVVVDFYTDMCGPCKLVYPDLVRMAAELKPQQVSFVKMNCNKRNKELGTKLGIKAAPTFHLYRNNAKVAEMVGAKMGELRALISDQQVEVGKAALAAA